MLNTESATRPRSSETQMLGLQKIPCLSTPREQDTRSPTPSELASESERTAHSTLDPSTSHILSDHSGGHYPPVQLPIGGGVPLGGPSFPQSSISQQELYYQQQQHHQQQQQQQQFIHQQQQAPVRGPGRPSSGDPQTKAFPCSTCGKGFARRSDLARHGECPIFLRI